MTESLFFPGVLLFTFFFLFSLFFTPACDSAELVLVDEDIAPAPVIIYEGALHFTRQSADELAGSIEKVSGSRPEVIEGRPEPLPERAVWVGYQPVLEEIFPGIDFNFEHPEEILIAASGDHLVIAGRDRWDPDHTVVEGRGGGQIRGWQQEFGTVNAVYTFLQDYLDVRWLWPGETGEDIIRRERIAFEPFEYRYHPRIRLRSLAFMWSRPTDGRGRISVDWARLQRLQLDSFNIMHNRSLFTAHINQHGGNWYERFHETNPEYLALQPDGTRGYWPRVGGIKLCKSNPGLWEQWLDDVELILEQDPTRHIFNAAASDINLAGYCTCENCRAWDPEDGPKRRLLWSGHSEYHVAMSDRQLKFANQLARGLRERYPERDYHVVIYGYGPSRPGPRKTLAEDNVIVAHCTNWFTDMEDEDARSVPTQKSARQFAEWAEVLAKSDAKLVYRPNLPGNAGLYIGHPDVPFGRVMETLRFIDDHGCVGLVLGAFWNYWPTQGPLYYMIAQLAWNPDLDGYEILDDYYRRGFGPAHGQLKQYWTLLEETRNLMVDGDLSWWEAYNDDMFARAGGLLDEAEDILADEPEIYRDRIAHVRSGLDFTRLVVENRELMARYLESDRQDQEAAEQVRENWQKAEGIVEGEPTFYFIRASGLPRGLPGRLNPDHD